MIPNNNFSVLPFYEHIEDQYHRQWYTNGKIYPLFAGEELLPFQVRREHTQTSGPITSFVLYRPDGTPIRNGRNWASSMQSVEEISPQNALTIKSFDEYDIIVWPAKGGPVFGDQLEDIEGPMYAVMEDADNVWYSEVFTYVRDHNAYLKLTWWDDSDFVMDAGRIVFKYGTNDMYQFKNFVYLPAELAKPDYIFEEEGDTRDGYFFPTKQISEKRYKFNFLAPEFLLDALRFVRMADHVEVSFSTRPQMPGTIWTWDTMNADSFLLTPEWEKQGDLAAVAAEFDTATVAKKIGVAYLREAQQ